MEINSLLSPALAPVLVTCASLAYGDTLMVRGLGSDERGVVALNARAGCIQGQETEHWVTRLVEPDGSVKLGNLGKGCVLNVAVFSESHAMLVARIRGWTGNTGEVRAVTLQPAIKVPVTVWITHKDLERVAHRHMERTKELYRRNLTGITFESVFVNVSADADNVKLINAGIEAVTKPGRPGSKPEVVDSVCTNIEALRGRAYTERALNVYYVKRDIKSRNCATKQSPVCDDLRKYPKANGNISYIGTQDTDKDKDNPATLAHELGHAFGLRPGDCGGHVIADDVDFSDDNIMVGGGRPSRNRFSLGQVFTMNTQKDRWGGTMLIMNQWRKGPGRECQLDPPEVTTSRCPALCLDWPPPGEAPDCGKR